MPELPSIQRDSTKEKLVDLYNQIDTKQNAGPYGSMRSHLHGRQGQVAWAQGKSAGFPELAATNHINNGPSERGWDWAQKEFRTQAPVGVTGFTNNGLQYSTNIMKVDTSKYKQ
jgi:hypothetical protein